MQMRHSTLSAALLGAALSLLPGCESVKSSSPSLNDASQAQKAETVRPDSADSSWQNARVGDRVTYAFKSHFGGRPGSPPTHTLSGRATLEVVAVQQPWAWVRMSFTDEAGKPLAQPRLAQDMLLPVRTDVTRTLAVEPQGESNAERPSAAGRTWDALRYVHDMRPVDGPLQTRVYAVQPGPLYLTHGLLEADNTLAGFRTQGGTQFSLVDFREGSGDASATPPALERPLGPGTYYERHLDMGGAPSVHRICFAAERGFVLRTEGPVTDPTAAPCADFSEPLAQPLEELLLELPLQSLDSGEWPPPSGAPSTRGTFNVDSRSVPSVTFERPEGSGEEQRLQSETYAADPWAPSLAGLPHEARFHPLSTSTERVGPGGQRQSEGSTRLSGWGTWGIGGQQ